MNGKTFVGVFIFSTGLIDIVSGQWYIVGKHIYGIFQTPMSWQEARTYCAERDSYLLRAVNSNERAAVQVLLDDLAVTSEFWIGAADPDLNTVFTWDDGSVIETSSYDWFSGLWDPALLLWHNLQPSGGQKCVELRRWYTEPVSSVMALQPRHFWNDAVCENQHGFICDRKVCGFGPTSGLDCDLRAKTVHLCNRKGKRDVTHVIIWAATARSKLQCVDRCLATPDCMATNYRQASRLCELLSEADEDPSVLVNTSGYSYSRSSTYC